MSFEPKQKDTGASPIIKAKSLLSHGDVTGAFTVLKKAAEHGDVMACYDCGFMMIQGIGCKKDLREGLKLISEGMRFEKASDLVPYIIQNYSHLFDEELIKKITDREKHEKLWF